jgi:pseudoazurin
MKPTHWVLLASAVALTLAATPQLASAGEHIIEMRNQDNAGNRMAFEPGFLKVDVGDTVKFVPTDKGHNVESILDVWPEGVPPIRSPFSREVVFTPEKDGLYVFKCMPHYGMGMIVLVQVGKPVNFDKLKDFKATGLARKRFDAEFAKVVP